MALSGAFMASRALLYNSSLCQDLRTSIIKVSSVSTSTPRKVRKFTNRKNYLRQKLFKTLSKPHSNSLIYESPNQSPVVLPNESSPDENYNYEQYESEGGEELEELGNQEVRVAEVAKPVEIVDSSLGELSKGWVFKYVLWLLGAFVFQTICAVWVLESADISDQNGNRSNEEDKNVILDVGLNGNDKSKVKRLVKDDKGLGAGGVIYLDEKEMEKKIEEIQVMAREARERERMGTEKNSGLEKDDSDKEDEEVDFGRSGIEKEVNDRLIKLRRRLGNVQKKLSVTDKVVAKRYKVEKDKLDEKKRNVDLMFKKKYRFRGSFSGNTDKPKGFKHSDSNDNVSKESSNAIVSKESMKNGEVSLNGHMRGGGNLKKDGEKKQSVEASNSLRIVGKKLVEREKMKPGKKVDIVKSEPNGLAQDMEEGRYETVNSGKASVLETPVISSKHNLLNQKDDLKNRVDENPLSGKIEHNKSESETDFWWLGLPYVLVIFMHRGLDDEEPRGPFALKSDSGSNSNSLHTVAFEDRGDAINFCYILQSFFENLEDFSAEIVPLSVKELKAAVDSQIIKVIVVKKGQLELYAGQPLPDVEMALRSLLDNSCK